MATTSSTPNTEFSAPSSPEQKPSRTVQDARLAAKRKLSTLSLEEKVLLSLGSKHRQYADQKYRSLSSRLPTFGGQRPFPTRASPP